MRYFIPVPNNQLCKLNPIAYVATDATGVQSATKYYKDGRHENLVGRRWLVGNPNFREVNILEMPTLLPSLFAKAPPVKSELDLLKEENAELKAKLQSFKEGETLYQNAIESLYNALVESEQKRNDDRLNIVFLV